MGDTRKLKITIDQDGNAKAGLESIAGSVSKLGALGLGAGLAGITALGTGLGVVGKVGLDFNNAMEQASAKINAFTKDGAETARILEFIKDEAAQTPFEFMAMANAVSTLQPAAKQSNTDLEDLLETAEILAASNPAQGLEGAGFALKEAMGGDFTSIIERFNLSRQSINRMKEEGVPAIEIVRRAMGEMGLDAGLVAAMAETAEGRWSTLSDTFTTLAGKVTQPIFNTFSEGLGKLNSWFTDNEDMVNAFADKMAGGVQAIIDVIKPLAEGETQLALQNFQASLWRLGFEPGQIQDISEGITSIIEDGGRIAEAFGRMFGESNLSGVDAVVLAFDKIAGAMETIAGLAEKVQGVISTVSNSQAGQAAGAVGGSFVDKIGPDLGEMPGAFSQLWDFQAKSFLNPNVASAGLAGALNPNVLTGGLAGIGQGMGYDVNGMADAVAKAITSALLTAPLQVNVTNQNQLQLDGKVVADSVSQHIGERVNQIRRTNGSNQGF